MIEPSLAFFEVWQKLFFPHSSQFGEAELRAAPKTLNPVHMVFPSRKRIVMMMDAMVLVTLRHKPSSHRCEHPGLRAHDVRQNNVPRSSGFARACSHYRIHFENPRAGGQKSRN